MQKDLVDIWGVINLIGKIPMTELLVGVIVPIMSAWISYYLAERTFRRKENNRLYIQIGLLKRELKENSKIFVEFMKHAEEKKMLRSSLDFPLVFNKNLLLDVLDRLQKIKSEYFYFSNDIVFDKPNCMYIWAQRVDSLNNEIEQEECKDYDDEYLMKNQKTKISELKREKAQLISEFEANKERNIYSEFQKLQSYIERNSFENMFDKFELPEDNFILLKHIYDNIKGFNEKKSKDKSDVALLYDKLVIFEISSDVLENEQFNQEIFDLYYRGAKSQDEVEKKLYDLCERYYKYIMLDSFLKEYRFDLQSRRWSENCSEMVILNDRDLYISIEELYEELEEFKKNDSESGEVHIIYDICQKYNKTILNLINVLEKYEMKIAKWCK